MVAPVFRAVTAKTYGAPTSGDDTTISVDGAIQNGDIMVLAVLAGGPGSSEFTGYATSTPAGWQPLGSPLPNGVSDNTFGLTLSMFWRKAASEPASYTVSSPGVSGNALPRTAAILFAVSGAQDAAPSFTFNSGTRNTDPITGATDITALSIDAPVDALVAFFAHNWDAYTGAQTVPSGSTPTFTGRYKSASNLFYLATGPFAAGGATGNKVQTGANALAFPWTGMLLAFSPATALTVFNPLSGRGGGAAQPLA